MLSVSNQTSKLTQLMQESILSTNSSLMTVQLCSFVEQLILNQEGYVKLYGEQVCWKSARVGGAERKSVYIVITVYNIRGVSTNLNGQDNLYLIVVFFGFFYVKTICQICDYMCRKKMKYILFD